MNFKHLSICVLAGLAACSGKAPDAPAVDETGTPAPADMAAATTVPLPVPAAAPPPPPLDLPARFKAVGTEPFWGAEVDGTSLKYSTPEFPAGMSIAVIRKASGGTVTYSGTIDGKPLELAVSAGPCSDGMSDTVYRFSATRTIGPDIQRGCAKAG